MSKIEKRQLRLTQQQSIEAAKRAREKAARRAEKAMARQQQIEAQAPDMGDGIERTGPVDCACLIHSNGYTWDYVEKLYNMLSRNISRGIRFHVYTEHDRSVPPHMIKHNLETIDPLWHGPRKSWWYKIQLFNQQHHAGPLLYFDLDTVVVNRLDWIPLLNLRYMWAPKDYRSLWRPTHLGINSSVMWFDTRRFAHVWDDFKLKDFGLIRRTFHGDQDYISDAINPNVIRHFLPNNVMSYRWQVHDGGIDFRTRLPLAPGAGTLVDYRTSVLVFHGSPKPHETDDPVIKNFWQ